MKRMLVFLAVLDLAPTAVPGQEKSPAGTPTSVQRDWPQWRGPSRDNISTETGLLASWPESGLPLEWEISGVGTGIAAPAVASGRVFILGYIGDAEYLTALDQKTCKRIWSSRIGPSVQENSLMRWLGQRMPTVDGDRVYAFHSQGLLGCIESATAKELWRKDYVKEFGSRTHYWGLCDRPLVDGEKLIITPGGQATSMVALRKTSGDVLWKSEPKGTAAHAATIISNAAGIRQYVTCLLGKVVSFRARDGAHLWTHEDFGRTANSCTPIAAQDDVVVTAGYGVGLALLRVSPCGDGAYVHPEYTQRLDVSPFQDSALLIKGHLYVVGGNARSCVEVATGKVLWADRTTGRGLASMTSAEGRLYVHHSEGTLALAEATPEKLSVVSTIKISPWQQATGATNPVIAGGRLYIRNENRLLAYDIRAEAGKVERPRPSAIVLEAPAGTSQAPAEAIYVPTPPDVVERMLEAAKAPRRDGVYALGR